MASFAHIRQQGRAWQIRFDALDPKVGDVAPDFEQYLIEGDR